MLYLPATNQHDVPIPDMSFLSVMCTIGGAAYGLPVAAVREVVNLPSLLPLAGSSSYVRGLLNLRGLFIPVLDGRLLVDAPAPLALSCQVIILGEARAEFGLIVDHAQSVHLVRVAQSAMPPQIVGVHILSAVIDGGDWAALLLDVSALRMLVPAHTPDLEA